MTLLLLVIIAMMCSFVLGVICTACSIEKRYPKAWEILSLEIKANKKKRADAAREKEARP